MGIRRLSTLLRRRFLTVPPAEEKPADNAADQGEEKCQRHPANLHEVADLDGVGRDGLHPARDRAGEVTVKGMEK